VSNFKIVYQSQNLDVIKDVSFTKNNAIDSILTYVAFVIVSTSCK